jgi:polyisoprenoid-binding protein YceI
VTGVRAGAALLTLAFALPAASADTTASDRQRYRIDVPRSRFVVNTQTSGLSSAFGHDHKIEVRSYEGSVTFTAGALDTASVEVVVFAASLRAAEERNESYADDIDAALRDHVLHPHKHPTISFVSRSVAARPRDDGAFDVTISGELRLHGVRRKLTVPVRLTLQDDMLRATGAVTLRQTDFNIVPFSFAGGTVTVANRVTLSFDIVARRDLSPADRR